LIDVRGCCLLGRALARVKLRLRAEAKLSGPGSCLRKAPFALLPFPLLHHPARTMPGELTTDLYGQNAADSYKVNTILPLSLSDGSSCSVATVLKAFLPPTQGLVLLVAVAAVPAPVILKIYDPRFMSGRDFPSRLPPRPWSLEHEIAAAERRGAVARGERADDYDEYAKYEDPLVFEEFLYRHAMESFEAERTAYERLRALQGDGIPRCYGIGTVQLPSPDEHRPRPLRPPFLLLEYVDGQTPASVDAKLVPRSLARELLHTIRRIGAHEVVHADLHQNNIIFAHAPSSHPISPGAPFSRAVVIDFGCAFFRRSEDSDYDWQMAVNAENDFDRVCQQLQKAGIRDESPLRPETTPCVSARLLVVVRIWLMICFEWNHWAENHQRWCEPTVQWTGPDGSRLKHPILWKLKPEAERWLETRDPAAVDPPRPGSPT
jgi:hypothetical protein